MSVSRAASGASRDEGFALFSVMVLSVVFFILATMLIVVTGEHQLQAQRNVSRMTALHVADAGVSAYLYQLRRNPSYYLSNPTLGPTGTTQGSWTVTAVPPTQTMPLTLRSSGVVPSLSASRTVVATVRFPTFADFMFLSDTDINIGAGALIEGKVRSNGNVNNLGRITGRCYATGTITGSGQFDGGKSPGAQPIDFAQVTADLTDIRTAAQSSGTYFGASGARGYKLVFSGSYGTLSKVLTVNNTTGAMTTQALGNVTIPASGVFYFSDDVWVSGTYAAKVTVASSSDILIPSNLVPQDVNYPQVIGLVATDSVIVPTWYQTLPDTMSIYAAMLAQTGTIYGDLRDGVIHTKLTIKGSMAYRQYSYFVRVSGSTVLAGFRTRVYSYDMRLDLDPPPLYPQIRDGSLKVSTWVEGNS